jgi:hypothetical protein
MQASSLLAAFAAVLCVIAAGSPAYSTSKSVAGQPLPASGSGAGGKGYGIDFGAYGFPNFPDGTGVAKGYGGATGAKSKASSDGKPSVSADSSGAPMTGGAHGSSQSSASSSSSGHPDSKCECHCPQK